MKRKVIAQAGGKAYTITLPIEWARRNGLSEKSELEIQDEGKSLTLYSQGKPRQISAHLTPVNWTERTLYVHLSALYARGVDEIKIYSDKDISKGITKSIANMIGFALVSQQSSTFIIKDISGIPSQNLDEIFKRVFQMILLFYDAAEQDIFGKEEGTLEELKARDIEVNKFCLFLERAINKMSYGDAINGRILFTYSFMLEKISDEIERLWRANIKYRIKKTREIQEIMALSKEGLAKSFDLYYQFNPERVAEMYALRDKVREKSFALQKVDALTTRLVHHIVKIIEDATDLNHLTAMRLLEKSAEAL